MKQELTPEYLYSLINENTEALKKYINESAEALKKIERKVTRHDRQFLDIEEEYPLLPPEADDLATAVKRKGVEVLGGKKSNAYQDTALRKRVYMDIYGEVKRQYGLIKENGSQLSYKKLKRKYLKGALETVDTYVAPITIQNDIDDLNDLEDIDMD